MPLRLIACMLLGLTLVTIPAWGQNNPLRGSEPAPGGAYGPDQPVRPEVPELQRRVPQAPPGQYPNEQYPNRQYPNGQNPSSQYPNGQLPVRPYPNGEQPVRPLPNGQPSALQQPPPPPFRLTPQQEDDVNRILSAWEKHNLSVRKFDCKFKRWTYDLVFGPADQARFVESGTIKFAAPDKGLFKLESMEKDGKDVPIESSRAEHWICDGRSVWEYSPLKKQVIEHKLPPELQGKAIADGPLPFLFNSDAQKLKQRYFVRIITPSDVKDQIWLEAYPREQKDAANFHHAQFMITASGMSPYALKIIHPDRNYTVYQFWDVVVNDPFGIFKSDPFRPFTPQGWKRVDDMPPAAPHARRTVIPPRR